MWQERQPVQPHSLEEEEDYPIFKILKYHNRAQPSHLSYKRIQILHIRKNSVSVIYQDAPDQYADFISYERVAKVANIRNKSSNCDDAIVVAITMKNEQRPSVSFRASSEEQAQRIVKLINANLKLISNLPDYSDLGLGMQRISDRIREQQPQYNQIYQALEKSIPNYKLKSLLFDNHPLMCQFFNVAICKGFDLEKAKRLAILKSIGPPKRPPPEQIIENYDFTKSLEGLRFQDDEKKLKLQPTQEEMNDDLFFADLPQTYRTHQVWDQFVDKIEDNIEEKEPKQELFIDLKIDTVFAKPIELSKPIKGRFKISQPKQLLRAEPKGFKGREQRNENSSNVPLTRKIVLLLRLLYSITRDPETTLQEVDCVQSELNRVCNGDQRPAPYVEESVAKTLKNILEWRRSYSMKN